MDFLTAVFKVILTIVAAVIGGRLKLTRALYASAGAVSAYTAYSLNKNLFYRLVDLLDFLSKEDSFFASFLLLSLPIPLLEIYASRKVIVWCKFDERFSEALNKLLGAFYVATIFTIILMLRRIR